MQPLQLTEAKQKLQYNDQNEYVTCDNRPSLLILFFIYCLLNFEYISIMSVSKYVVDMYAKSACRFERIVFWFDLLYAPT